MATLLQPCPACNRELELPADAQGRLAKCPACDVTFTIGETATKSQEVDNASENESTPAESEQPSMLQIVGCPIEDVLSKSISIFKARWSQFLAPLGVFTIASLILIVIPIIVLREFWQSGFARLTTIGLICWAPLVFFFATYVAVAFARAALVVARNEIVSRDQMAPPIPILRRGLLVAFGIVAVLGFAGVMMYSFTAVMRNVGGSPMARVLTVFAFLFTTGLTLLLIWQIWAWIYACADNKASAAGSLRVAIAITAQNKLTSFFLVLTALVLALIGTLMCLVGHIITVPLTIQIFAVAYLLMTGQPVADPKDA